MRLKIVPQINTLIKAIYIIGIGWGSAEVVIIVIKK